MSKSAKILLSVSMWLCLVTTSLGAELMGMEITQGAYVGGGITGTVVGFGSGHLIQGQTIKGLTIMSTQLAAVAIGAIGWAKLTEESTDAQLLFIGAAIFGALKVYETYDLWETPQRRGNSYYVPVNEISIRPDVALNRLNQVVFGITASMNI